MGGPRQGTLEAVSYWVNWSGVWRQYCFLKGFGYQLGQSFSGSFDLALECRVPREMAPGGQHLGQWPGGFLHVQIHLPVGTLALTGSGQWRREAGA